ncbi:uncharacterized protein B0I36DRAFT_356452 [Microdochium trichocladiopsis]|uniref:Uncharacterized protein n=1 Tax=Microdochium trichocladiopsis TaxID=1682393 RepID=A0A9P8XQ96_9PEZI|nr:uncharacterized protein B0I36DRAFT_356452 [Microdochium trichocladiopsis]KAH7010854.1 hypothetical protein B0I36DRAFT_356452 [Microdochium trichocladiopsis]
MVLAPYVRVTRMLLCQRSSQEGSSMSYTLRFLSPSVRRMMRVPGTSTPAPASASQAASAEPTCQKLIVTSSESFFPSSVDAILGLRESLQELRELAPQIGFHETLQSITNHQGYITQVTLVHAGSRLRSDCDAVFWFRFFIALRSIAHIDQTFEFINKVSFAEVSGEAGRPPYQLLGWSFEYIQQTAFRWTHVEERYRRYGRFITLRNGVRVLGLQPRHVQEVAQPFTVHTVGDVDDITE